MYGRGISIIFFYVKEFFYIKFKFNILSFSFLEFV